MISERYETMFEGKFQEGSVKRIVYRNYPVAVKGRVGSDNEKS